MDRFYLRTANQEDIDLLFRWVNDKELRYNSFNPSAISYIEHKEWFQKKIMSKECAIFIYYDADTPVGQIRIDILGAEATVSYSIDSTYRFLGHGKIILQLLEITLRKEYPEIKCLRARVKHENIASQVKFEQLNYEEALCTEEYIEYQKKGENFGYSLPKETNIRRGGGIIFLTNNRNALPLYDWLVDQKEDVILFSDRIKLNYLAIVKPDLVISYGYRYLIDENIIEFTQKRIINLHISLLPWNKGAHPNFWSFIENTPKGVTIHQVNKEIDCGNILIQEECFFDERVETLKSTYEFLHKKIQELFKINWQNIKTGNIKHQKQGFQGSYHALNDFKLLTKNIEIDWNQRISSLKDKLMN